MASLLPIRAFIVSAENSASVIAFAASASEAKRMSLNSEWLEDCDWPDLRAKREKRLDAEAQKRGASLLTGSGPGDDRLMRGLGWHEFENEGPVCDRCALHTWEHIPESFLVEQGNALVCRTCAGESADANLTL